MDLLDLGVERGIISAGQRDALRALDDDRSSPHRRVEARRGLNAVTIAYWSGGIAVLLAFGWFLASRWAVLGPGGVLVVALVYAVLFAVVARVLSKQGFRQASAISTLLVVGMSPLIAWSLLALGGQWDLYPPSREPLFFGPFDPVWNQLRWLPIDLAVVLAALIALRKVKFGVLALPIAAGLAAFASHSVALVFDLELAAALGGRLPLLLAFAMLTIGYTLDMRTSGDEDYAVWFYLVGIVALAAAIGEFWRESSVLSAHGLLLAAVIFAFAAVHLGRRIFLIAAFLGFVVYLGYLAFDVFKEALEFPVALATVGMVVILSAVWLQRRYPSLVRRGEPTDRRPIPGAPLALGGALLIALVMIPAGIPEAKARIAERYWQEAFWRRRHHNEMKYRDRHPSPERARRVPAR